MKKNRWTAILMAVILCFGLAFAGNGKLRMYRLKRQNGYFVSDQTWKTMLNNTDRMQGWCDSPLTQDRCPVAEAWTGPEKGRDLF